MSQKTTLGTLAVVQETQGTKTTGRSHIGKMAKRIKTPDLHLSQRNLRKNSASKFSSANKYAALSVDGEDENEGEDYAK